MLGLGVLIPVAALPGALAVAWVPRAVKIGLLAFVVAALLYLVVEELLVKAHHIRHRTSPVAATFFLGFLIILIAEGAGGLSRQGRLTDEAQQREVLRTPRQFSPAAAGGAHRIGSSRSRRADARFPGPPAIGVAGGVTA